MIDPNLESLQTATRKAFATTYGFLLMAQCYHWNVEGPNFLQYHDLFGKVYFEVDKNLDAFAEHVRSVRAYVPARFTKLIELSSVEEPEYTDTWPTDSEMLYNLYLANGKINTDLIDAYNKAEIAHELGLANFLSERMDQHRKHGWMLYSIMKVV
jgi:starvation-inducible DNA-binding protein